MPPQRPKSGGELFIVDNADDDWKVQRYLHDWCDISRAFDIATAYFEIGSLLALDGEWQKLEQIRILMGDEVSRRTKKAFEAGLSELLDKLDGSIESAKDKNDFLSVGYGMQGTLPPFYQNDYEKYQGHVRLLELTSIRLPELITRMSTSPASILGIDAGTLSVGATADICIYSDDDDWQLSQDNMISQGKNTPFYGWNFNHKVRQTLVRGKISYRCK